jgi:hypothetical protein
MEEAEQPKKKRKRGNNSLGSRKFQQAGSSNEGAPALEEQCGQDNLAVTRVLKLNHST